MRGMRFAGLSLASTAALIGLATLPASAAAADSNSATINISDSGFSPTSVSVPLGGTVTWTDTGSGVHTASSMGGVQTPFDSGGLSPAQSYSFTFTVPGTYQFTSATDCQNGNKTPGFDCSLGTVTVGGTPAATSTTATQPAPSSAAPAPSTTTSGEPQQLPTCTYVTDMTHPDLYCAQGQTQMVTLPAGAAGGGAVSYTFNYPGDASDILLDANVSGVTSSEASAVGADVFDSGTGHNGAPVEIVNLRDNQFQSNPNLFRVAYSSNNPGPVTIQLFNWTDHAVTLGLSQSGLVRTDGSMSPVTLQLGSATPKTA